MKPLPPAEGERKGRTRGGRDRRRRAEKSEEKVQSAGEKKYDGWEASGSSKTLSTVAIVKLRWLPKAEYEAKKREERTTA